MFKVKIRFEKRMKITTGQLVGRLDFYLFGHGVANGSPPLRHFFQRSCAAARAQLSVNGSAQSLKPSVKYSEYMKHLICISITRGKILPWSTLFYELVLPSRLADCLLEQDVV